MLLHLRIYQYSMLNAEAKIMCDRGHYTICKQNFPALLTFELMTKFHFNYHGLTPIYLLSTRRKTWIGAFSVIVKLQTLRRFVSSSTQQQHYTNCCCGPDAVAGAAVANTVLVICLYASASLPNINSSVAKYPHLDIRH